MAKDSKPSFPAGFKVITGPSVPAPSTTRVNNVNSGNPQSSEVPFMSVKPTPNESNVQPIDLVKTVRDHSGQ